MIYNALISDCQQAKQLEQALQLFKDMKQQGVVPDVITYNVLISMCSKVNHLEKAFELFEAHAKKPGNAVLFRETGAQHFKCESLEVWVS